MTENDTGPRKGQPKLSSEGTITTVARKGGMTDIVERLRSLKWKVQCEMRDKVAQAIADSISPDQENPGVRLWDLLDFSGENKAHMACRAAADAAIATVQEAEADTITTLRDDNAALREGLREIISRGDHLGAMTAAMADVRKNARALLETNHAVK